MRVDIYNHLPVRRRAHDAETTYEVRVNHDDGKTDTYRIKAASREAAARWAMDPGDVLLDVKEVSGSRDAESESHVGKYVLFQAPAHSTASGKQKLRGKVTRVMPDGRLEVRVAEGGYHMIRPDEIAG